jgi:dTDP-4-dehydrorhamnose reductase
MKILVTGANGQLGNEIKALAAYLPKWNFLFTDVDTLDITNEQEVYSWFASNLPSFIINCAAYTAVDKAEKEKEIAHKINALAPGYLARYAAMLNSKIIHISTDYVFDGTSKVPYIETDDVNPISVYGKTKLEGELNLIFENPASIIIRTSWLYSSYGTNFVKTMLRLGKEKPELKVVSDQTGTPTYAADLANVILSVAALYDKEPDTFVPGVYHYSNEGQASWQEFATEIFRLTKTTCKAIPISTAEYPTPAKRPMYSVMDKTKIKTIFGFEIPEWKVSLKNCIKIL